MMTSMWQRWTNTNTPTTAAAIAIASDDCLPDDNNHDLHETIVVVEDLPRQVDVGLSIDASIRTETSSLSDFEEGMPLLWARSPPRSSSLSLSNNNHDEQDDGPHPPLNHPPNIPMPQRMVNIDTSNSTPQTLTQRSGSHVVVSLPVLAMNQQCQEDVSKLDSFPLVQTQPQQRRMIRLFCAVLAVGFMTVSTHYNYFSLEGPGGTARPDLPTFEAQPIPQLATFDNNSNNRRVRRSSVAFARASSELPVFPAVPDDDEVILFSQNISNSSPLVSFLGGCAFVAILLETGWKGYQKSKILPQQRGGHSSRGQTQAIRRLYKY